MYRFILELRFPHFQKINSKNLFLLDVTLLMCLLRNINDFFSNFSIRIQIKYFHSQSYFSGMLHNAEEVFYTYLVQELECMISPLQLFSYSSLNIFECPLFCSVLVITTKVKRIGMMMGHRNVKIWYFKIKFQRQPFS